MRRNYISVTITLVGILTALSACSTKLDPKDRALLVETQNMAQQAVSHASMAIAEAKAAREAAERAAMEAAASGKKADRIFREAQQK